MSVELLGVKDTLSAENAKYEPFLKTAEKAFNDAYETFISPEFAKKDGWKKESETPTHDVIYSKHVAEGKAFALRCELPGDIETVFKDNWSGFETVHTWNVNMAFAKTVARLSEHADILHYGNREMLVVKGRDYVVMRIHRKLENGYMTVAKSIPLDEVPEGKDYVRGELLLGAGRFTPKEGDPNVTVIDYMMCIDLKGLIPKAVVNQFMAKMMLNDVATNKKHVAELMTTK